jgi:squalene-hopene cyclase-like protein
MRVSPVCPGRPAWDAAMFPGDLDEPKRRLADRVRARIDGGGALREPCGSRVLETALAFRALRQTGDFPDAARRMADYLHAHRDDASSLNRLLARAALDQDGAARRADVVGFLRRVPQFTSARKRATLIAFLAALGVPPDDFDYLASLAGDGLHSWARAQVTAVKVILAVTAGHPEQVTAADIALLRDVVAADGTWERDLLIHLSAVHALLLVPGTREVAAAGMAGPLRYQRPDGGMPFVSDVDTWCTATGGVALAAAGVPPAVLHSLAGHLTGQQSADGAWSFSDGVRQCDTDDVSVTLEFLQLLDPVRYADAIDRGLGWLRRQQAPGGGFPTYPDTPPEGCMAAAAVNALSVRSAPHAAALGRAVDYLASQQLPDGAFPPDWSASRFHTIFRTVLACTQPATAGRAAARRIVSRALGAVRQGQNADGGWGQQPGDPSDALSTAYALIALTRQADPEPAVAGMRYLLGAQRPDGSIETVPDSIGPRPLVFSIPALPDIFALLALGHVTAACHPAPRTAFTRPRWRGHTTTRSTTRARAHEESLNERDDPARPRSGRYRGCGIVAGGGAAPYADGGYPAGLGQLRQHQVGGRAAGHPGGQRVRERSSIPRTARPRAAAARRPSRAARVRWSPGPCTRSQAATICS